LLDGGRATSTRDSCCPVIEQAHQLAERTLGVVLALPAWRSDQASVVTAATPERQRDTKGGGHGHDTQYPSPAEQDAGGSFVRGKPDLQSIGM
jgi:hypothetical protein